MGTIARTLWFALVYASFATLIMIGGAVAYFYFTVGFEKDRSLRAWATLNGVDIAEIEARAKEAAADKEDISHDDLLEARVLAELDRDMRQQSIRQGIADLNKIKDDVATERYRYKLLKEAFDDQLSQLAESTKDDGVLEVQQTLQTIKPKLAKDHLVRMLPPGFVDQPLEEMPAADREAVYDIVSMMKAMPLDKRRKILEEFKTEDDAEVLAELLRLIRLGVPNLELIGDARSRLQEFGRDPAGRHRGVPRGHLAGRHRAGRGLQYGGSAI